MALSVLVAGSLLVVHLALRSSAVVAGLLRLTRNWNDFLRRQIHWVHALLPRGAGRQVSEVEAFGQAVLASHWLAAVARLVVVVGLASLVEVVALAHLKDEHLALTAFVACHSAARYSVPVVVQVIPSSSSRLGALRQGD